MKRLKYIFLAVLVLSFYSCGEDWIQTNPDGATVTEETKAAAEQANPAAAEGAIRSFGTIMADRYAGLSEFGLTRHNDFGWASVCLITEAYGQDFVGDNVGYNWFGYSKYPDNRNNTVSRGDGMAQTMIWTNCYKIIRQANEIIESVNQDDPGAMLSALCIAKTYRAFAYLQLAQYYQFTYVGNQDKPCVPILKEGMTAAEKSNNPRATVQAVYDLIMADLDFAIENFGQYRRPDKGIPDKAVAYGLRARANLIMQKYDKASADAQACLTASKATPLSIEACKAPGFANASAGNVIWANLISVNSSVVLSGIINWISHLSSWYEDGYSSLTKKYIDKALYDLIPETDVRKYWWNDVNGNNKMFSEDNAKNLTESFQKYVEEISGDKKWAYVVTKFGTGDKSTTGKGAAAGDWILMRAEEMELIIAECDNTGEKLKTFVIKYRDPSYTLTGDVKEAVWLQRRIELWGEGFAFTDLLRLNKGVTRAGSNWPMAWQQTIPAGDKQLLCQIPQVEITANQGISDSDNNPL